MGSSELERYKYRSIYSIPHHNHSNFNKPLLHSILPTHISRPINLNHHFSTHPWFTNIIRTAIWKAEWTWKDCINTCFTSHYQPLSQVKIQHNLCMCLYVRVRHSNFTFLSFIPYSTQSRIARGAGYFPLVVAVTYIWLWALIWNGKRNAELHEEELKWNLPFL